MLGRETIQPINLILGLPGPSSLTLQLGSQTYQRNSLKFTNWQGRRLATLSFACRLEKEDIRHHFALCSVSKEISRRLQNKMNVILNMYFNGNKSLQSHTIIIGYLHTNTVIRIFVNFLLHILKLELWKIRNIIRHDSVFNARSNFQ